MQNNDYSSYELIDNPFPQNPTVIVNHPDMRINGTIFYEGIFEEELKDFNRLLANKTNIIYIRGTQLVRGDGKSAIMAYPYRKYSNAINIATV